MTKKCKKKPNLNYTLFSSNRYYSIQEIAEKTNHSTRTVNENWRKEGLEIEKGKIKGSKLIEFLKNKKQKRSFGKLEENEYYCTRSKQKTIIRLSTGTKLLYKHNRFKLLQTNTNYGCQNYSCKYHNQNLNCHVSKIISTKLAVKLYKEFFKNHTFCIDDNAKEKLNKLIDSSVYQPSLKVENSNLTSNAPTVVFDNETRIKPINKTTFTQSNLQTTKEKKDIFKPRKRRPLIDDEYSRAMLKKMEEKERKKYHV